MTTDRSAQKAVMSSCWIAIVAGGGTECTAVYGVMQGVAGQAASNSFLDTGVQMVSGKTTSKLLEDRSFTMNCTSSSHPLVLVSSSRFKLLQTSSYRGLRMDWLSVGLSAVLLLLDAVAMLDLSDMLIPFNLLRLVQ